MRAIHLYIQGILCLLLAGCSKEITLRNSDPESKLVLNCILIADEPIVANVSHTANVTYNESMYVNNAIVELWTGNTFIEEMKYTKDGEYTTQVRAKEGMSYTLKARVQGYEQVEGTDSVPKSARIIDSKYEKGDHPYISAGELEYYADYSIVFNDDPKCVNFYEVLFAFQMKDTDSTYFISLPSVCRIPDPVIDDEGLINFFPETYIFSDQRNNGSGFNIEMSFSASSSSSFTKPLINGNDGSYTILRTISKNYYVFLKSWYIHRYNLQLSSSITEMIYEGLTGNPIPLYTNVKNGYGIVVAYSQTFLKTELIDHTK
jgi:hypothetical protein